MKAARAKKDTPLDVIPENNVRELRKKLKLSQGQLAKVTGIELSVISRIENRQRNISGVELILLSHNLKATPHQIYKVDFGFPSVETLIDQTRMDGVIIALLEAYESNRMKPSPDELAGLITFLYHRAVAQRLSLAHVRDLAKSIVKAGKKGLKADPLDKVG